jgi:hypothetical protein
MTRRPARHTRSRTLPRSADPADSDRPPWSRWWNSITKAILSVGALAGAVSAVLVLLMPSDPEDSGHFTEIRITSDVPLSEYVERAAAIGVPQLKNYSPDTPTHTSSATRSATSTTSAPSATTSSASASSRATATTSASASSRSTATSASASSRSTANSNENRSSSSSPTATSPDSAGGSLVLPNGLTRESVDATIGELLHKQDVSERSLPAIVPMIIPNSLDSEDNPVPPEVAAERVVKVLKDARTTAPSEESGSREQEPLGVVVSTDIELADLRAKPALLSWSMWQKGGDVRLHGDWLNKNLAYRLEATTNRDTTTVDLWIPLPQPPGPYLARVDLNVNGSRLAAGESDLFD